MAIVTVSTTAELDNALTEAVGGDIIKLEPGTYTKLTKSTAISKASEVIVRSEDRTNPAVFNDQAIYLTNANNITFDGINFIGTAIESTKNGIQYPLTDDAMRFDFCSNIKVKNCIVRFYRNGVRFHKCVDGVTFEYSSISQIGVDPVMVYGSADNVTLRGLDVFDFRIDPARRNEAPRHPDALHIRTNDEEVDVDPFVNLLIEDCRIDDPSGYAKAIFHTNENAGDGSGATVGEGVVNLIVRRNQIAIGRWAGISWCGGTGVSVTGNRIRRYNAGVGENPTISPRQQNTGVIANNVYPRNIWYENGATASMFSLSNNVLSSTADPIDWVELVPGDNVGAYGGPEDPDIPVAPTAPTTEWLNPPTNTDSGDGRIGNFVEVTGQPGRYTGVLIIDSDSVAWDAVSNLPTLPGTDVSSTLNWIRTGITTPKGFKVANPAINGAGARRYEMIGGPLGNLDIFSVTAGATMSGITWRYFDGSWSDYSAYTGSFTAPLSEPEPEEIPALGPTDWEVFDVVAAPGLDNLYTGQFKITGVAFTGAQWTKDGESNWRALIKVGEDGGDDVLQMLPDPSDPVDHAVGYLGASNDTISVRLRYSTDVGFGPESTTAKDVTGPAPPPPPVPFDEGDLLSVGGNLLMIGGFAARIAGANRPGMCREEIRIEENNNIFTLTHEGGLPPGAIGRCVFYDGQRYEMRNDKCRFVGVPGSSFAYLAAYDALGAVGRARHKRVLRDLEAPGSLTPLVASVTPVSAPVGTTFVATVIGDLGFLAGTIAYQWNDGVNPIVGETAFNYVSDTATEELNCTITVTNATGAVPVDSNPVRVIEAPTALNPTGVELNVNSGTYFIPFSDIFDVAGDSEGRTLTVTGTMPTGFTIDLEGLTVAIDTATTGTLAAEEIVFTGTNAAGSVQSTLTQTIVEVIPAVAPVIDTLTNQTKTTLTGKRFYNISSRVTGTEPIEAWMMPKVFLCEIIDNGDGTYTRRVFHGGQPEPVVDYVWEIDNTPVSGETGITINAMGLELSGNLTLVAHSENEHGEDTLESAATAVDYGAVTVVNPVHLGTTMAGTNNNNTQSVTSPAYSTGDLVVIRVAVGQHLAAHSNVISVSTSGGTNLGPNGEPITTVLARFDTGANGLSQAVYKYIATNTQASGTSVTASYTIFDQIIVSVSVFDAGTFDETTPISHATANYSNVDEINASTGALTAANAGGMVVSYAAAFADAFTAVPGSWTALSTALDVGTLTAHAALRDAFTTLNESVAAADFTLAATATWATSTFVINPSAEVEEEPTITNPVLLGSDPYAGTAAVTHNLDNPAYSTGDLVLVWGGNDSGLATTPNWNLERISDGTAVGPDGETITRFQVRFDNTGTGTGGTGSTGGTAFRYTAAAPRGVGTVLRADLEAVSDQASAVVAVYDAGTFDTVTPIQNAGTTFHLTAGPASSKAFTADEEGGVINFFFTADSTTTVTPPAGWSTEAIASAGGNTVYHATRDTVTTAAESVAAADFALGTSDGWSGVTVVVNPHVE